MLDLHRLESPVPHPAIVLAGQDLTSGETTWTAEPHVGETAFSGPAVRWGTDYMHARYYKPIWGRFLSVDPSQRSAHPSAPQSWNRYAYVQGNPMRAIDPNGENMYDVIAGIGNGLASSMNLAPRGSGNSDFRLGQFGGDVAALIAGQGEMQSGGAMVAGGGVTEPVSAGTSTVVVVAGAGLAVHGAVTIATAGRNIGVFLASQSEGGSGGGAVSLPGEGGEWTKLKGKQGWRDGDGNTWKKDQLHKDHWDVSDRNGNKVKEVDFKGRQIWPGGPKNKNKQPK